MSNRAKTNRRKKKVGINITTAINNFLNELSLKFMSNKGLGEYLETIGSENAKNFSEYAKRKRNMNKVDEKRILDYFKLLSKERENRQTFYLKEISKARNNIYNYRKSSQNKALKELKREKRDIRKTLRWQYGFFKGLKKYKEKSFNINYQQRLEDLTRFYYEKSNPDILEYMVFEI